VANRDWMRSWDRTDLAVASITRIETLGFHRRSETERAWLGAAIGRMQVLALSEAVEAHAIALRQERKMGLAVRSSRRRRWRMGWPSSPATWTTSNTSPGSR